MLNITADTPMTTLHQAAAVSEGRLACELAERDRAIADLEEQVAQLRLALAAAERDHGTLEHIAELATTYLTAASPTVAGPAFLGLRRAVAERQATSGPG